MHGFEVSIVKTKTNNCAINVKKFDSVELCSPIKSSSIPISKSTITSNCPQKRKRIEVSCEVPCKKKRLTQDLQISNVIHRFNLAVHDGPLYICTSCSQTWFKEGVVRFNSVKMSTRLKDKCIQGIKSVQNVEWLCLTCKKHLISGKIPECSVGNDMKFPTIPNELVGLSQLEQRLISPRIPFMSIRQQPRGGQLCMKGNVVNVPADVNKTVASHVK